MLRILNMSNFNIGSFFTTLLLTAVINIPCSRAQTVQLPDFTHLVSKNAAAVVNISTTIKIDGSAPAMRPMPNIPEDSPFNDFFKIFSESGLTSRNFYFINEMKRRSRNAI